MSSYCMCIGDIYTRLLPSLLLPSLIIGSVTSLWTLMSVCWLVLYKATSTYSFSLSIHPFVCMFVCTYVRPSLSPRSDSSELLFFLHNSHTTAAHYDKNKANNKAINNSWYNHYTCIATALTFACNKFHSKRKM